MQNCNEQWQKEDDATLVILRIEPDERWAELAFEFALVLQQMFELFCRKQNDYGPDNIAALGVKGVFVRMWDKVNRLKTLVWDGIEPKVNESTEDTFLDIAVYGIIALLVMAGKWPGTKIRNVLTEINE